MRRGIMHTRVSWYMEKTRDEFANQGICWYKVYGITVDGMIDEAVWSVVVAVVQRYYG